MEKINLLNYIKKISLQMCNANKDNKYTTSKTNWYKMSYFFRNKKHVGIS